MSDMIENIYKAVRFIDNNLKGKIGVGDIADEVSYSLYHFCRSFNKIVHHTPYDYLMRRRLSESALELLSGDKKIIDIAFDYGFNNPETYSRAFKRMFAMQPIQWRKRGLLDQRSVMPGLTLEHLLYINREDFPKPRYIQLDILHLVGLMTHVRVQPGGIRELWDVFLHELDVIGDLSGIPDYYGLKIYLEGGSSNGFFYMAAVEARFQADIKTQWIEKVLPSLKYVCFTHPGSSQDLHLTTDYIYHTWLPYTGMQPCYSDELERYTGLRDVYRGDTPREILVPVEFPTANNKTLEN